MIQIKEFPYEFVKQKVFEKGYKWEFEWCENLGNPTKTSFFEEYVWCVIYAGMSEKPTRNIFNRFKNDNNGYNFNAITHQNKKKAITKVFDNLDSYFRKYTQSLNKLMFLESLPYIGKTTKFHLARNLGLECAKPDVHLTRIAELFNTTPQKLCEKISKESGDKIGSIDIVVWRFALLYSNYLEILRLRGE